MKKFNFIIVALAILAPIIKISAQENPDYILAKSYFFELDSLCSIDNGKLWGVKLYGPTMLVNPETRLLIANQPDKDNILIEKENVFIGKLPENINIANTSFNWNGVNWTMLIWNDIPQNDKYSRNKLLIHESWHRVQEEIGIASITSQNAFLDELQGSILIKLELIALTHAYTDIEKSTKVKDLTNAFTIRKYRQLLFPGNNENAFERHEGMAEYTGFKLCGLDTKSIHKVMVKQLESALEKDGFTNSFAYLTGPAYGFLFDELHPGWLKQILQGKDIPTIGSNLLKNENIPSDTTKLELLVTEIIETYKAEPVIKAETEKFEQQKKLVSEYEQKIMEGSQLIIPNNKVNFSYNPMEKIIPIDDKGVIYKTMRLTGDWGILEVRNGIFRSNDWQVFIVSAPKSPDSGIINETDYDLTLNTGWKIIKVKDGTFTLKKE